MSDLKKREPVDILIKAVKFYATKEHWMSLTDSGDRRLLVALGGSIFHDGWAEAHGALQAYAIASTPPAAQSKEVVEALQAALDRGTEGWFGQSEEDGEAGFWLQYDDFQILKEIIKAAQGGNGGG